jgi:DNA polymerase V
MNFQFFQTMAHLFSNHTGSMSTAHSHPILLFSERVPAGFPSPADGYADDPLDVRELLIQNPAATFFVRADGDSMEGAGIFSGDIVVVDRSLTPQDGTVVLALLNGEFTLKRIWKKPEGGLLMPENPRYAPIPVTQDDEFSVWGVATFVIHALTRA